MSDNEFLATVDLFKKVTNEPKYKQIVDAVIQGVRCNKIFNGDKLPSINAMSKHYSISRDTVQKAYELLREKGVIESAQGKGFVICNDRYNRGVNVFVMFDVLNEYKEKIYSGIKNTLEESTGSTAIVDFYFHHCNAEHFVHFLENNSGKYEYYVVLPFNDELVKNALGDFDQEKLLIVDRCAEYGSDECSVISQNHDDELTRALEKGKDLINKYSEFVLCFPEGYHIPEVLKHGYSEFCLANGFTPKIISNLECEDVQAGTAYFVIEDIDLVTFVKAATKRGLKVGEDVGVLSYNNTPLKEIIEGGVSVVSIDFYQMGVRVAEQIINRNIKYELMPTEFIKRNTL